MKWKHKYIVGMAMLSLFFAQPLSFAAEDDVIVFGGQYEDDSEPVSVEIDSKPSNESPSPTQPITENNNDVEQIEPSDNEINKSNEPKSTPDDVNEEQNNTPNENTNQIEQKPIQPKIISEIYDNPTRDLDIDKKDKEETSTNDERKYFRKTSKESQPDIKKIKARFVKLFSDESYEYYLDRKAVRWINMPYSTSEYMADVWIRMLDKPGNTYDDMSEDWYDYVSSPDDEISEAAAKGIIYDEVDVKVLRTKKYYLEHYYIRPKTNQIQYLCQLEIIGRPQNTVSERPYDYKNWENLIPGSAESMIYYSVLSDIGTGKASKRGHMTFIDMLDEYARIALN